MTEIAQIDIRDFRRSDASRLLVLMRALAEFEGYADEFAVADFDLVRRGLCRHPEFRCLVAEAENEQLVGMAVYYQIPFTHDLRPDMVLKELFVVDRYRSMGVGHALMKRLIEIARQAECARVRWLVLRNNCRAKQFYKTFGANHDEKWESWLLKVD